MTTYRPRGASPPSTRRYGDPRALPNAVIASPFDPRFLQQPRSSAEGLPSSRGVGDRLYDAQPIAKRVYPDQGYSGGTKSRTEYAVRPRTNSATAEERRRPISIAIPPSSPIRSRPVVSNSARDVRPRSPIPRPQRAHDDAERYITPAVSSPRQDHQRHYSAIPADLDRLSVSDRDRRERARYHGSSTTGSRSYPTNGAVVRYNDSDVSYTGPREQFDRDYPSHSLPPVRRDTLPRRERPNSALDFAEWKAPPPIKREAGPPPSAIRQFERIDKSDTNRSAIRSGGAGSDNERDVDVPKRRHTLRAPVSLHQDRDAGPPPSRREDPDDRRDLRPRRERRDDDDTYASDRDHRDHQLASNHHERPHRRHRDPSPITQNVGEKVAAVGLGGVAAAGLAGMLSKKSRNNDIDEGEEPQKERRRRNRREKDFDDDDVAPNHLRTERPYDDREIDDARRSRLPRDRAEGDVVDEKAPSHRRRHRKHREKDDIAPENDSGSSSEARNSFDRPRDESRREVPDREVGSDDPDRRTRVREPYNGVPGEEEDDRPRRVQLVEPPKEKEQEVKPKGILKPARQVPFPEDPNPTREGVAPLKEAGKKGIPPGARWTKINRKLVNPAALDALHERFEERDEYVIVLRVLTREEIEKFAALTAEIRGT